MIRLCTDAGVARITLADPTRHNALDFEGIAMLRATLADVAQDPSVRVVVLTGEGRSFCAGARLDSVGGDRDWTDNPFVPLCADVEDHPLPIIARLNGGVFGAGVDLALSCDFRIGVEGMQAAVPAAALGIHYPPEGIARARAKLGAAMARRIFLAADRLDGSALLAAGAVDALVAPDQLDRETDALALRLAGLAPLAVRGMKTSLRAIEAGREDPGALGRIRTCFASEDHREGLAARTEKRTPAFKGR